MNGFATDFDGTLFFGHEEPSIRIRDLEAIQLYQEKGNLFGVCTGRPFNGIYPFVKEKIDFDFFILSSGALILDKNKKELFSAEIDRGVAQKIYESFKNRCNIAFQIDRSIYFMKQVYPERFAVNVIETLEALPEGPIRSISLRFQNEIEAERELIFLDKTFQESVQGFQNTRYIDIVPKSCSKGNGIKLVKEVLKLNSISGIGDSLNDFSMFDAVDVSFGMKSGSSLLEKRCDYLVDSVFEALEFE